MRTLGWEIQRGRNTIGAVAVLEIKGGNGHFGYVVQKKWQNRGIGRSAAIESLKLLKMTSRLKWLFTLSRKSSISSNAILLRCGFRITGTSNKIASNNIKNNSHWHWQLHLAK
jgi:RimJ/RimL family protein N-acetyltransferase